ncbi:F-box/LRR-repeat protein 15-like isoform X2 [Phlebotomus argentipes]|uniref:F-box/LRR-repeat protein 15-like isoform X2 n=1 Tax=Phlebotomus argentipes TaxID=94469 RepID=UPI002892EB0F|nr:F-box/LRR-repeat protein 15-like isoform X2 [Phlebotomus argentipes]
MAEGPALVRPRTLFGQPLDGEVLPKIAENCRKLKRIILINQKWLTDDVLYELLINNIHVKIFDIRGSKKITYNGLRPLTEFCKELISISIVDMPMSNEFLRTLHWIELKKAEFSHATGFNAKSVDLFIRKHPKLECIDLQETGVDVKRILRTIAKTCPNLFFLDVDGCENVSEGAIRNVAQKCSQIKYIVAWVHHQPTVLLLKNRGIKMERDWMEMGEYPFMLVEYVTETDILRFPDTYNAGPIYPESEKLWDGKPTLDMVGYDFDMYLYYNYVKDFDY